MKKERRKFLNHSVRALIALVFCFEILIGYFWPGIVLAQGLEKRASGSPTQENNISCSITEKYSIVYSYNTVLGEEPDLKLVNLICIALKKKKRSVVYESIVNYIKSILEKNDNLRLKAGINAFKSIFGESPDEEQMKLLNQIVFEGPTYSYSELKVLLDLNKDGFTEIAQKKKEKGFELAKKETKETLEQAKVETQIEKHTKALVQGPGGQILNSGFCTNLSLQSLTERNIAAQADGALAYLDNVIDVDAGNGTVLHKSDGMPMKEMGKFGQGGFGHGFGKMMPHKWSDKTATAPATAPESQ